LSVRLQGTRGIYKQRHLPRRRYASVVLRRLSNFVSYVALLRHICHYAAFAARLNHSLKRLIMYIYIHVYSFKFEQVAYDKRKTQNCNITKRRSINETDAGHFLPIISALFPRLTYLTDICRLQESYLQQLQNNDFHFPRNAGTISRARLTSLSMVIWRIRPRNKATRA